MGLQQMSTSFQCSSENTQQLVGRLTEIEQVKLRFDSTLSNECVLKLELIDIQ